ncbi:MAG: phenylacetate--CoA ligase family protein [Candidatus Firestonebacteria bacterium]
MKGWNKLDRTPWRKLKCLQEKKLQDFLQNQLYPFSPYYHELFDKNKIDPKKIKTVSDLHNIPFTSKLDLLPTDADPAKTLKFLLHPDENLIKKYWPLTKLVSLGVKKILNNAKIVESLELEYNPIFVTSTTGRSAIPTSFLYTMYDINNLYISGHRLIEVFDLKKRTKGINLFPYAPHLAFWQTVFGGLSYNILVLSTGGGKVMGTEGNIRLMMKLKPELVIGVPGYVYHLIRKAVCDNYKLDFIKRIVLGASYVPQGFKTKLADLLEQAGAKEVKIFGTYGFTEARCAWAECPTDLETFSGYHTSPDKEIFEIINPKTGEVKKENESGELVYTSIDARGSCVFRYRTGDLIEGGISYEPCKYCGRTVPRISSRIGRVSEIKNLDLSKIKGTVVDLNNLSEVLAAAIEITEWQLEIRKKDNDQFDVDELILCCSIKPDTNTEKFKKEISDKILTETEVSLNDVVIISLEQMIEKLELDTALKEKRIIDKRQAK